MPSTSSLPLWKPQGFSSNTGTSNRQSLRDARHRMPEVLQILLVGRGISTSAGMQFLCQMRGFSQSPEGRMNSPVNPLGIAGLFA
jgi:hypothetical protein